MELLANLKLSDLKLDVDLSVKSVLCGLGALYGAATAWSQLRSVFRSSRLFLVPFHPNFRKFGEWVVVTGATDGIGKGFAEEFAAKGLPIVLISRSQTKLDKVAAELEEKYGVQTKTFAIDFGQAGEETFENMKNFLLELDIGVLVNNVGVSSPAVHFLDTPDLSYKIRSVLDVNLNSVCRMTEFVLPGMVDRKRGLLINVSAMAALRPFPNMALYGASKSFIDYFSQTIQAEYRNDNIVSLSVKPAHVVTKMVGGGEAGILSVTPNQYARSVFGVVGKEVSTPGCWQHDVTEYLMNFFPDNIFFFIADKTASNMMENNPALKNAMLSYTKKAV